MSDHLNSITRGCSFSFELELVDSDSGDIVPFLDDDVVVLSVKKTLKSTDYAFQIEAKINGGIASIHGEPHHTAELDAGSYFRDVQLKRGAAEKIPLIPAGLFIIAGSVNHD